MQSSIVFKSSTHCRPSPDGRLVATCSSSTITFRSTETLQVNHVKKLPSEISGPISMLAWSPSSSRYLVATVDQIHVFSLTDSSYHATIRNPAIGSGKLSTVQFGAHDSEVIVCSSFGLKLVVFDLPTSKGVEISNPKFHQPSNVTQGFAIRPETANLALLTRVSGKDAVSIHHPKSRQVLRSWYPDTLDAQGLTWTPNGQWLLLWESSAHGRKLLLYTPDGQFFRSIGPSSTVGEPDADLEPGIKLCRSSPDATLCAVGDHGRSIGILGTQNWRESLRLVHPTTIVPRDTLQVWQEQVTTSPGSRSTHTFVRATQMVSPPSRLGDGKASVENKTGCSLAAFDASSMLLATRLDDSPCTLWIWDVTAGELRAVLIFHSAVNFSWHPSARELLLINCQDDGSRGLSFVWDPLSNGPKPLNLKDYVSEGKIVGKPQASWIFRRETEPPVLLLSDAQHYLMVCCADADQCPTPWREAPGSDWALGSAREGFSSIRDAANDRDMSALVADDTSTLEDTFSFKYT